MKTFSQVSDPKEKDVVMIGVAYRMSVMGDTRASLQDMIQDAETVRAGLEQVIAMEQQQQQQPPQKYCALQALDQGMAQIARKARSMLSLLLDDDNDDDDSYPFQGRVPPPLRPKGIQQQGSLDLPSLTPSADQTTGEGTATVGALRRGVGRPRGSGNNRSMMTEVRKRAWQGWPPPSDVKTVWEKPKLRAILVNASRNPLATRWSVCENAIQRMHGLFTKYHARAREHPIDLSLWQQINLTYDIITDLLAIRGRRKEP